MESDQTPQKKTYRQSVPVLARLWNRSVKTVYGDTLKPLGPKEFGQLKLLVGSLDDVTLDVMSWAVSNWDKFCSTARINSGLPSAPPKPHIGFLLAHRGDAINLMVRSARKKDPKTGADIDLINRCDQWWDRVRQRWERHDDEV
jgi:hypothetical protein